jgi:2-oxoglutarate ferredoxin oxidoreductase subunit gamma
VTERVLIAGSGGQGVILIGKVLATVAVNEDVEHVTFFPAYGIEVRGGAAHCQVILSTDEIASPVSEVFDAMIVMNQESAAKFRPQMTAGCTVFLNRSMCPPPSVPASVVEVAASEMALQAGDARAANFIMLGAYLARRPVVTTAPVEKEIKRMFSGKDPAVAKLNIQAFRMGLNGGPA